MAAGGKVVKGVHHDIELRDERHPELGLLDVVAVVLDNAVGVELEHSLRRHLGFGLANVVLAEEKLAV